MLDTSLEWYRVILKRSAGTLLPEASLPKGFTFVMFQAGDEESWAEIETSVFEFNSKEMRILVCSADPKQDRPLPGYKTSRGQLVMLGPLLGQY